MPNTQINFDQQQQQLDMPTTSKSSYQECEPLQSVPQQHHHHANDHLMNDHNASKLLSSEDRLSPNLFLNLNFDNSGAIESNANSLKFEWSNFNPTIINSVPSTTLSMSPVPHASKMSSNCSYISSPTYEFLNIDQQFNIDHFKNECILNLDHNLLSSVNDNSLISNPIPGRSIELHSFSLDETKELLDLEKPINLNNL